MSDLLALTGRLKALAEKARDTRAVAKKARGDGWANANHVAFLAEEALAEACSPAAILALSQAVERMEAIDNELDAMRWLHPDGYGAPPVVEMDWFVGDGSGFIVTRGATICEATDAYLAILASTEPADV